MALIKCIECGKEISDRSDACPNCGCPTVESINENKKQLNLDKVFYTCPVCKIRYENGTIKCDVCGYNSVDGFTPQYIEDNTPKCPTCGSTNIKKISGLSKAGSVAMWGIFSRKVHKQWHCNNCGSEW